MRNSVPQSVIKTNFLRAKLFVVEDNDDQWMLIQQAMKQALAEVVVERVATCEQALENIKDWQYQDWDAPKLILLDLYLPASEQGWKVLQMIKQLPSPLSHIPVVMFSSSVDNNDIIKAYELGVASYLIKPTTHAEWTVYFNRLRSFWWETVALPDMRFTL